MSQTYSVKCCSWVCYYKCIIYIFVVGIIIIPDAEILKNITICKFHIPDFLAMN